MMLLIDVDDYETLIVQGSEQYFGHHVQYPYGRYMHERFEFASFDVAR